jgi:putative glutamine amidotransferase
MQRRPVIGIPTQTLQTIGGIPADFPPSWAMSQRYILALTAVGAIPWMIPLVGNDEEALRAIYEQLDGVFLPGGADIDPDSYGEVRHPLCDRTDPSRDAVELMLAKWAMEERKPVLGVCRGVQVINLAAGGTLYQDLSAQYAGSIKHDYFPFGGRFARDFLAHEVRIEEHSRLGEILGVRTLKVNSMHHQGIKELGAGLVATAFAPDGLIEAAETAGDHFYIGVQWHPEALAETDEGMRRLFASFVEAAGDFRNSRLMSVSLY